MSKEDPGGPADKQGTSRDTPARRGTVLMSSVTRVREWKRRARSKDSLLRKLYIDFELPFGLFCLVLGGIQNQLYAWSHDFAADEYVGVPLGISPEWKGFWGFTGAQWEYFNLFFAQGSALVLALLGGYLVGNSVRRIRTTKAIWKNMLAKEQKAKQALLEAIKGSRMTREKKENLVRLADPGFSSLEKTLLEEEEELEKTAAEEFQKKHPKINRIQSFLERGIALPITMLAHLGVLAAIHYTWSKRYYEDVDSVGPFHESVFWNWMWFAGAYTTYTFLTLAAYSYFYDKANVRMNRKLKKLRKKEEKLWKKKPELMKKLKMLDEYQESIGRQRDLDIDLYKREDAEPAGGVYETKDQEPGPMPEDSSPADPITPKRSGMVIRKKRI